MNSQSPIRLKTENTDLSQAKNENIDLENAQFTNNKRISIIQSIGDHHNDCSVRLFYISLRQSILLHNFPAYISFSH